MFTNHHEEQEPTTIQNTFHWQEGGLIFCEEFYEDGSIFLRFFNWTLLLSILVIAGYSAARIYLMRMKFSIRQRAPLIGIFHIMCYAAVIIVPMVFEIIKKQGWVEWGNSTSASEVPFTRYLGKFLLGAARIGIAQTIVLRVVVIYSQWKKNILRKSKYWRFLLILCSQSKAILIGLVLQLLHVGLVYNLGSDMITNKPVLDWYNPSRMRDYQAKNLTILRIFESVLSITGLFLMRNLHDKLNIFREYAFIITVNTCFNWYYEMRRLLVGHSLASTDCAMLSIRSEFIGDMIRSSIFPLILALYCRSTEKSMAVPAGFIGSFPDFCRDEQCVSTFKKYLQEKCPESTERFDDSLQTLKHNSILDNPMCLDGFTKEFQDFKKTRSFHTLRRLRVEEECISSIGYTTVS